MEPRPAPSNKRSWPLLALGACAFLPGFGLLFAAAAVTWGLVSDRPRARWGVILGGAGALLNLVGGAVLVARFQHAPVVQPIPLRLLNIYDQTAGFFVFPRVYEYHLAGDGSSYDLFALGPDGQPGTADDVRPALPDSVLRGTGYRPVR